jgi:hypothetical protein
MEEKAEDYEEAQIVYGEDDIERSRKYILSWVQKRILQDFQDNNGIVQYQLSAHTEKVFQWLFQDISHQNKPAHIHFQLKVMMQLIYT